MQRKAENERRSDQNARHPIRLSQSAALRRLHEPVPEALAADGRGVASQVHVVSHAEDFVNLSGPARSCSFKGGVRSASGVPEGLAVTCDASRHAVLTSRKLARGKGGQTHYTAQGHPKENASFSCWNPIFTSAPSFSGA